MNRMTYEDGKKNYQGKNGRIKVERGAKSANYDCLILKRNSFTAKTSRGT